MNVLGPAGVKAFQNRKISRATAERLQIYTGRRVGDEVVPDASGNIICFPFFEDDKMVAEKYRGPQKRFWQRPNPRRTFYNAEALDLCLNESHAPLVIVEGEIDCASAIEAGWQEVVSVPDGAPATALREEAGDHTGKFEFLYNNRHKLREIERFIIAVDNDGPGKVLADELVRRLGASRCSFVTYPDGCKDLNDVLVKGGRAAVLQVLNAAQPYPVRGLYRLSEYPDVPPLQTFATGWETLDHILRLFPGELMVVTGIPGHGKSSWVINLAANCARLHGWRTAIFSPEMPVVPHIRDKLRAIYGGRRDCREADGWIEDYFLFLDSDPGGAWQDDEDKTLEWIIDKAGEAVMRDGIRMLIVDPWNEIEHCRARGENGSEYIGRAIRRLRRFGQDRKLVVIIVAHPTKEIRLEERAPGLYDIDGSANWANKPDHGVSIYRAKSSEHTRRTEVHVTKVRFSDSGEPGMVRMAYDQIAERFRMLTDAETKAIAEQEHNERLAAQAAKAAKRKKKDNVVEIRPGPREQGAGDD